MSSESWFNGKVMDIFHVSVASKSRHDISFIEQSFKKPLAGFQTKPPANAIAMLRWQGAVVRRSARPLHEVCDVLLAVSG